MIYLLALALLAGLSYSTAVTVKVEDPSGAPLKNQLVIVQNLSNHEHEIFRELSDSNGSVSKIDLKSGIYRAIATDPYGNWETEIREFLVNNDPSQEVVLQVSPMPTHGRGDIVPVRATSARVLVLAPDRKPVPDAEILARDDKATLWTERWYKTDANGTAQIEIDADPMILVVVYSGRLLTTRLKGKTSHEVIQLSSH